MKALAEDPSWFRLNQKRMSIEGAIDIHRALYDPDASYNKTCRKMKYLIDQSGLGRQLRKVEDDSQKKLLARYKKEKIKNVPNLKNRLKELGYSPKTNFSSRPLTLEML